MSSSEPSLAAQPIPDLLDPEEDPPCDEHDKLSGLEDALAENRLIFEALVLNLDTREIDRVCDAKKVPYSVRAELHAARARIAKYTSKYVDQAYRVQGLGDRELEKFVVTFESPLSAKLCIHHPHVFFEFSPEAEKLDEDKIDLGRLQCLAKSALEAFETETKAKKAAFLAAVEIVEANVAGKRKRDHRSVAFR